MMMRPWLCALAAAASRAWARGGRAIATGWPSRRTCIPAVWRTEWGRATNPTTRCAKLELRRGGLGGSNGLCAVLVATQEADIAHRDDQAHCLPQNRDEVVTPDEVGREADSPG